MADSEKQPQNPTVFFGGCCACGRITYESTSFPKGPTMCHCVTCRKIGGGPFQCFPDVVSKEVIFYDNKERLRYEGLPKDTIGGITFLRFSKVSERAFCVDCYSQLAMRYKHEYDTIGLTLATVDENTIQDEKVKKALMPVSHIFASQNPWWYDIKMDGLPTRERFGGDFEEQMKLWESKHG